MSKVSRPSTVLTKAVDHISQGWCKGTWAASKKSKAQPDRWCAVGAVEAAAGMKVEGKASPHDEFGFIFSQVGTPEQEKLVERSVHYLDKAVKQLAKGRKSKIQRQAACSSSVMGFNDAKHTTRPMVKRVFEIAAELARKDEQRERQARSRNARQGVAV